MTFASCGGDDDAAPAPVLENARRQVAIVVRSTGGTDPATSDVVGNELPAPDPSLFEGSNRVVNLWLDEQNAMIEVDVWARRTFSEGPALLADGLAFGDASPTFGAPGTADLVVVAAGAGPDGVELGGMINAVGDEAITTVFTAADRLDGSRSATLWERGSELAPVSPPADRGLIEVVGVNLSTFGDELLNGFGADTFAVGDGSTACLEQRGESAGFAPSAVGSGRPVELDLRPGPIRLTLHPFVEGCASAALHAFDVTVVAGASVVVLVYTTDGETLRSLVLPAV